MGNEEYAATGHKIKAERVKWLKTFSSWNVISCIDSSFASNTFKVCSSSLNVLHKQLCSINPNKKHEEEENEKIILHATRKGRKSTAWSPLQKCSDSSVRLQKLR